MVQAVHGFLDAGRVVPPVEVQNVNVGGTELLKGGLDGDVHGLHAVSGIVNLVTDRRIASLEVGSVLKNTAVT